MFTAFFVFAQVSKKTKIGDHEQKLGTMQKVERV